MAQRATFGPASLPAGAGIPAPPRERVPFDEAAWLAGYGAWGTFWHVALPLARTGIVAGTALALMEALAEMPDRPPAPETPVANVRVMVPDVDSWWSVVREAGARIIASPPDSTPRIYSRASFLGRSGNCATSARIEVGLSASSFFRASSGSVSSSRHSPLRRAPCRPRRA